MQQLNQAAREVKEALIPQLAQQVKSVEETAGAKFSNLEGLIQGCIQFTQKTNKRAEGLVNEFQNKLSQIPELEELKKMTDYQA